MADGPPFTALLTARHEETDRELRLVNSPNYGLVGKTVRLQLEVLDHGSHDDGGTVAVTVTEDGQVLANRTVIIGTPVGLDLPVRHAGPNIVQAAVATLPSEVSSINNQVVFTLNGIQRRLNVLLISGSPDLGERSWRLLLKSDPATQLVDFTILRAPGETIDADPSDLALVPFPVQKLFETDIDKFDLIILDRFRTAGLLPAQYLANIAAYVENGGALLAELGPDFDSPESLAYSPLGAVLPAQPVDPGTLDQAFAPTVTAIAPGIRLPLPSPTRRWRRVPDGDGNADLRKRADDRRRQRAAADPGRGRRRPGWRAAFGPVLAVDPGRRPRRPRPADARPHGALATAGAGVGGGGIVGKVQQPRLVDRTADARFGRTRDVTVTAPGGAVSRLALHGSGPGQYGATVTAAASQRGVWKITEGGFTAFAADPLENAAEYQDLAATGTLLRPVSRDIVWLGRQPAPPLAQLIRPRHASAVTGTRDIPLLPPLPTALVALALLSAAWWREAF